MKLDKFSNPIFNEVDLFDALYLGHQSLLSTLTIDDNYELSQLISISELNFNQIDPNLINLSVEEFDKLSQEQWFMPKEYFDFDVYNFCINKCQSDTEITRVIEEIAEFKKRNMIHVLQWLKYFVDTCLEHNIVWGVGRGSSVSSFVLYLLNVHRIDSVKYNLDWHEFLR